MELKFEELNDQTNIEETQDTKTNEVNYINYWSNANPTTNESTTPKKPKVSYDDILSSLNMVVNNGVLQFAKPIQQTQTPKQKKQVTISNVQQDNYITNKYFKDYKDQSQDVVEEPKIPLTKEEYRQMLIQDYINRQNAIRRISQIKSKRLLFDTQHINIAPTQMPRDMNKLFSSFRRG
jgi:hypothetical protein